MFNMLLQSVHPHKQACAYMKADLKYVYLTNIEDGMEVSMANGKPNPIK